MAICHNTNMTFEEHRALVLEACKGNIEAVECIFRIGSVFRVWDNVWDGDRECTKSDVDQAFATLAFGLARNEFFKKNQQVLTAQILLAWNAWHDANIWEKDESAIKRNCAWFIRDYCNEIVSLCAWIIGGEEHMRSVSLKVREAYLRELVEAD